jgi:pullulanase/glycogen debranching enzyme
MTPASRSSSNRDGSDGSLSINWGAEGPTEDKGILVLRRRLQRNQLACLFLAQGVPLLLAGDEVSNSRLGNNYAYAQDNDTGWVDRSKQATMTPSPSSTNWSVLLARRQQRRRQGVGRWCSVLDTSDAPGHATALAPGTNWSVQVHCVSAFAGEP